MTERERQDAFVDLMGGSYRADRLDSICKNSYPGIRKPWATFEPPPSKEEMFKKKAKQEGFTDLEIDTFLNL